MKVILKKILQYILKILAQSVILKYQPDIIGITGSVGKTNAKEAIYAVLKNNFRVSKNLKNYNNEIGVPLSIIGIESGNRSFIKWARVFYKALKLLVLIDRDYPEILVLEMGADKKGDISYLTKIAKPKVAVVTAIAPVHLEFFKNIENVIEEKKKITAYLKEDDWLVYNNDYYQVKSFVNFTFARSLGYGFSLESDLVVTDPKIIKQNDQWGTSFEVTYKGNTILFFLPDVLGKPQIYAALAGIALGLIYELNLLEINKSIKNYKSAKSRLYLLKGIKNTLLIDDSYNSSPQACLEAINILKEFPLDGYGRRWAVLGDMLELGSYTEEGHELVGQHLAEQKIDYLVTVGERAKDIKKGTLEKGLKKDNIYSFNNNKEAGHFIQEQIRDGDLILIKGSQGVRMEKITKELMAEPNKATELICRQEEIWLKK